MKKILIAVAVLVVLYPAVAWLMGFAIEQRFEGLTDEGQLMMPQLHLIQKTRHGVLTSDEDSSYEVGSTLKFTRHYHRGWYGSVDETMVEMSGAALDAFPALRPAAATASKSGADGTPFRFSFRTVIHHGPLCGAKCFALAGAETHVRFTGLLQDSLARLFGNEEPFAIRTRFGFVGGGSATMSSPAFEHAQIGDEARLGWGGLDGTMNFGAQQDWYDFAATAPALRLEAAKGTLAIDGMSLDVRAKRALRTLYGGDTRMELKRLSVTDSDKAQQFTANDLRLVSENHAQDRFMSVSAAPQIEGLARALRDNDAPNPSLYAEYFEAGGDKNAIPPRAGYYVGYRIASLAAGEYSLYRLAHLRGPALHRDINRWLDELAKGKGT